MVSSQPCTHSGVKAGCIRWRPHQPVHHPQQHEQDEASSNQHQSGDDEIMQDRSVAVRHLDRPDKPAGDQKEQRKPVPDPGEAVAQPGEHAGTPLWGSYPATHGPSVSHDDVHQTEVQNETHAFFERVVSNVG